MCMIYMHDVLKMSFNMKIRTSLLFFVICCMSGYLSASESSSAPYEIKKSLAEQLKEVRESGRAQRKALFKEMKEGIQLATIPERTRLQEKAALDMPFFAPLYKGVNHDSSFSGKKPVPLFGRVLLKIPFRPDEDYSISKLEIVISD